MATVQELQALGREAHAALQGVTAQDAKQLTAIREYMTALEESFQDPDEDDEDDEDDDSEDGGDCVPIDVRKHWPEGLEKKFKDMQPVEEGRITNVRCKPVFYEFPEQDLASFTWKVKEGSRASKPCTLTVDYGKDLDELEKNPLFQGFRLSVYHDDPDDSEDDEEEDDNDAGAKPAAKGTK